MVGADRPPLPRLRCNPRLVRFADVHQGRVVTRRTFAEVLFMCAVFAVFVWLGYNGWVTL